ncbi:hypothetical protein LSG25_09010 [Paralcaligenes sp. KSB-10]|jgi:hypothetical protein|nr:hypothetical protein [Paralcaligenes sp. KSB-10]UHL66446.1 hypothetical protein LSG25_09010 [Paralcaligenes sp. KSB-10]
MKNTPLRSARWLAAEGMRTFGHRSRLAQIQILDGIAGWQHHCTTVG